MQPRKAVNKGLEDILIGKGIEKNQVATKDDEDKLRRIIAQAVNDYLGNHPAIMSEEIADTIRGLLKEGTTYRFFNAYNCSVPSQNPYLKGHSDIRNMKLPQAIALVMKLKKGYDVVVSSSDKRPRGHMIVYFKSEEGLFAYLKERVTETARIIHYNFNSVISGPEK